MKYVLLPLLLLAYNLPAQTCDCSTQLTFVKNYFEQNNPAFQHIRSDDKTLQQYDRNVKGLEGEIRAGASDDNCNLYLERYIALLSDHHSGIGFHMQRLPIDFTSATQVDSFKSTAAYRSFARMPADTLQIRALLKDKVLTDVEGYYTNGGNVHFAILPEKEGVYTGVVVRRNLLMDAGHILLELKRKDEHTFESVFNTGLMGFSLQRMYCTLQIRDGQIPELGFFKPGAKNAATTRPYEFRAIDGKTNYIRLGSFDRSLIGALDTFYFSIRNELAGKPYLVIDLRDNTGGDEQAYLGLVRYLYTRPLTIDLADVWVSPDNILRYQEMGMTEPAERMKRAKPYTFIPLVEDPMLTWTMDSMAYPRKVALLYNRNTASAAEGMIIYGLQSDKVITFGESSGGYIGYGNVTETTMPCGKFTIRCSTTRYAGKMKYEFTGIPPMHPLTEQQDWIKYATSVLQQAR